MTTPVTYTLGHEPALATGANTFTPQFLASFATVAFSSPTVTHRRPITITATRDASVA